jgi:hypothetical protein
MSEKSRALMTQRSITMLALKYVYRKMKTEHPVSYPHT